MTGLHSMEGATGASTRGLLIGTRVAQALLATAYTLFGAMKATQSLETLATMMNWVPDFPVWFVRGLGTVEVLGGIGLILPALTGIKPGLVRLAALSIVLHQFCAVALHVAKGEFSVLGLNAVLIVLALIVLWGRKRMTSKRPPRPA